MKPDVRPRVAVIFSRLDDYHKLPSALFECANVVIFESAEQVVDALGRGHHFDGLFFDTGHFLQAMGCVAGDKRPVGLQGGPRRPDPEASGIWREMHLHEARQELGRRECGANGIPTFDIED